MIVRPLDLAMVQQTNEISHIKQNENQRPMAEQQTLTTQMQKDTFVKAEQVTHKENADNDNKKFDAKDKSENEYLHEKNGKNKKRHHDEGKVTIKGQHTMDFDIRI